MKSPARRLLHGFTLVLAFILIDSGAVLAQQSEPVQQIDSPREIDAPRPIAPRGAPVKPSLQSTTQTNPRGADIVEPAPVYRVSRSADGRVDTTFVGMAKVPDPRRNEVGSTVNTDLHTGTFVRLGGAWVYNADGLRPTIPFDESRRDDLLVFRPGPHDDVVSLQGVEPVTRAVGDVVAFDLRALYRASTLNPITGGTNDTEYGAPRLAMLRMKSTYPGGEAVDLAVVLAPVSKPVPLQAIRIERRDTTILSPRFHYVINEYIIEERNDESDWTAAVAVESGIGHSSLSTTIPATLQLPFSNVGQSGTYYIDGMVYLRRHDSRWALRFLGTSDVSATEITPISHHQVALYADARFEQGSRNFVLAQISGEMTDKQYQEFDWDSADYAGSVLVGFGRRAFTSGGQERARIELVAGLRMGENRKIAVFETRDRSRGLGPHAMLSGELARDLGDGLELRFGADARGYSIFGRGHRDHGFAEKGLLFDADARIGKSFLGVGVYAGLTTLTSIKEATFQDGGRYFERKVLVAPGLSFKTQL